MEPYWLPAGTQRLVFQTSRENLERQGLRIPERSKLTFHAQWSPDVLQLAQYLKKFFMYQIITGRPESRNAVVVEDDLIAQFRRAIDASKGLNNRVHGPYYEKRTRILRNFEEFINAHLSSDILITDICKYLGISQRTLEYMVGDLYGMSPRRYLTLRRLSAVRNHLMHAEDTNLAVVSTTARRFGFRHLGRFAKTYRSVFGELPSHSLKNH